MSAAIDAPLRSTSSQKRLTENREAISMSLCSSTVPPRWVMPDR